LLQLENLALDLGINTNNHRIWPSQPNALTRRLKYVISNLKAYADIHVRPGDDSTTKHRTLCIEKGGKISISPIPPIHNENRAQVSSDTSIDADGGIDGSIDTAIDTDKISIPENGENRAQNEPGIDSIDSIDVLPISSIPTSDINQVQNGKAKVVNVKHAKRGTYIYIGRLGFYGTTKWGNPFRSPKDGTIEEIIAKYRDWLFEPDQSGLLRQIPELWNQNLGCHCYFFLLLLFSPFTFYP
jgi:hypothetical protein